MVSLFNMEVPKNGKEEDHEEGNQEEGDQEEEIEKHKDIDYQRRPSIADGFLFFRIVQIAVMVFGQEHTTSMIALHSSGFSRTRSTATYPRTFLAGSSTS